MNLTRNLAVRVSKPCLNRLDRLMKSEERVSGERLDRSQVVRQLIARQAAIWLDAPYVVKSSQHTALVLANGDIAYRALDTLELLTPRTLLPASISLKPELQAYLETRYANSNNEADSIRRHWKLNHFSARLATDAPSVLDTFVDRGGFVTKGADLEINQPAHAIVVREVVAYFADFVEWHQKPTESVANRGGRPRLQVPRRDRAGVPIHVPTANFRFSVAVDSALLRSEAASLQTLDFEFRNGESARLQHTFSDDDSNPQIWTDGHTKLGTRKLFEEDSMERTLQTELESLGRRIADLAADEARDQDGQVVVSRPEDREALQAIVLPEDYLFGCLEWKEPVPGLEVCITWPKPRRHEDSPAFE